MNALELARPQPGLTTVAHRILVPMSMGLAVSLARVPELRGGSACEPAPAPG